MPLRTQKSSPVRAMSGLPLEAAEKRTCQYRRSGPRGDISNPRLGSLRIAHSSLMFAKLEIEQRQRKRRDTTVVAETLEVEALCRDGLAPLSDASLLRPARVRLLSLKFGSICRPLLALTTHVDQIVRKAGEVKGDSDDHHRVESSDYTRCDIGRRDCTGWTVCTSCSARR